MKLYIIKDKNNRVQHCATTPIGSEIIEVELDEMPLYPSAYTHENGVLTKDEAYEAELISKEKEEPEPSLSNQVEELKRQLLETQDILNFVLFEGM